MSKKLKKWQIEQLKYQTLIEREKERTKHLVECKNKEIEQLKNEIKAQKEIDAIKDATIQVFVERGLFGKYISKDKLSFALKNPKLITMKNTKNGYRLKVE